jgi:acyl-CoA thioester hydrolase
MSTTKPAALLERHGITVRPEWTDYNGHMNLAYYLLAFDYGTDNLYDLLDLGRAYRDRVNRSMFTLEAHLNYERELDTGAPLRVTTQLIDFDAKRVHYFHCMHHAREGYLAATNELLAIHVDLAARRAAPFPREALDRLERLMAEHAALPTPPQLGHVMRIPHKA